MQAEIITIGDEILIGQIVDTNSAWMSVRLNEIGIHVKQITTVADRAADILVALTLAAGRADVILVTGGLGPTKDDVTKQTLCTYFGRGLRRDPEVLRHVEGIFSRSKRPMPEVNRQQADVLENADVLFNSMGTAPGMWISHQNKHYVILPGVPFEMKHLMQQAVLPRLSFFEDRLPVFHHTVLVAGIGESFLAEKLEDIERNLPSNIHLAYLPQPGLVRLRLTGIGADEEVIRQKTTYYARLIGEAAGPYFVADGDVKLEEAVLELLKKVGSTLSTAESCTGGNIARSITLVPGSSQVFLGSAVTYSNEAKEKLVGVRHETLLQSGAVSEETVIEMAEGCKTLFASDYAIAVSGIAGPDGGTETKPVGTVWIAVAGKAKVVTRLFQFGSDRSTNIDRATAAALYELFVLIKEENIG